MIHLSPCPMCKKTGPADCEGACWACILLMHKKLVESIKPKRDMCPRCGRGCTPTKRGLCLPCDVRCQAEGDPQWLSDARKNVKLLNEHSPMLLHPKNAWTKVSYATMTDKLLFGCQAEAIAQRRHEARVSAAFLFSTKPHDEMVDAVQYAFDLAEQHCKKHMPKVTWWQWVLTLLLPIVPQLVVISAVVSVILLLRLGYLYATGQ